MVSAIAWFIYLSHPSETMGIVCNGVIKFVLSFCAAYCAVLIFYFNTHVVVFPDNSFVYTYGEEPVVTISRVVNDMGYSVTRERGRVTIRNRRYPLTGLSYEF